jgi:succinate dehydrogenase/fumarate reductase flavoprotein subunit
MQTEKAFMETDVVIIGYGGTGAAAAITAHDNGASVVILEKMPHPGGNTRVAAGMHPQPNDSKRFADYLKVVNLNTAEPEVVDAFVKGLMELPDWYKGMGGELVDAVNLNVSYSFNVPHPTHPGVSYAKGLKIAERYIGQSKDCPEPTGGARMFGLLQRQVERRGIKVMLSTPVKELVKNQKGEIIGVIAESNGKNVFIKAKKGVVMACGGFENNDAMKRDCFDPVPLTFFGNPGNTGDGVKMVQKIGGALWHMGRQVSALGFKAPGFDAGFFIEFLAPGFIYVDKYGERFINENDIEPHDAGRICREFDNIQHYEYPRVPFWSIFDEEVRKIGPINLSICGYNIVMNKYQWSLDNSAEVSKGWIIKANSISDLAKKISIDAKTLESTIAKYNSYCKAGNDADFGRRKEALKTIEGPPFYAIAIGPVLINSQGGACRDKEARVLDPDGKPIPRLYAGGEFGSIWGYLYEASVNIPETVIFGRIAGKNAASNPPLES